MKNGGKVKIFGQAFVDSGACGRESKRFCHHDAGNFAFAETFRTWTSVGEKGELKTVLDTFEPSQAY